MDENKINYRIDQIDQKIELATLMIAFLITLTAFGFHDTQRQRNLEDIENAIQATVQNQQEFQHIKQKINNMCYAVCFLCIVVAAITIGLIYKYAKKRYDDKIILDVENINIKSNNIYAVVGMNGRGK